MRALGLAGGINPYQKCLKCLEFSQEARKEGFVSSFLSAVISSHTTLRAVQDTGMGRNKAWTLCPQDIKSHWRSTVCPRSTSIIKFATFLIFASPFRQKKLAWTYTLAAPFGWTCGIKESPWWKLPHCSSSGLKFSHNSKILTLKQGEGRVIKSIGTQHSVSFSVKVEIKHLCNFQDRILSATSCAPYKWVVHRHLLHNFSSQQSRPLFWDECILPTIQLACRSRILTPNITLKANGILWCLNIKKDSLCLWGQHQISGDYSPWQFFEAFKSLTQILSTGCQTRRIPGVAWMWSPTSDHGRSWSPASPHQRLRLHFSLPSRWGCWWWFEKALSKDGEINRKNSK